MFQSLRRMRAVLALCFGVVLCAFALAGPATAASSSPYPPNPPAVCAASNGGAHIDGAGSCIEPVITHHNTPNTPNKPASDDSALASTGFDTAIASVVVVALLAVGGLCLVAGRRRRHS